MLTIKNLTKKYGNLVAVSDLSLTINDGEVFGFIGPNGAGKSTTIRSVLNFLKKDSGTVFFNNEELTPKNINLKKEIGYLPSEINLYNTLTGKQMIDYEKSFYKDIDEEYVNQLITRLQFDTSKKIETYSLGNKKKLGIILSLMHNPKLIIMDEATSGLDPLIQEEFYKIILEEKAKGKTILFSSHNLGEVKKICDQIGIIRKGKLILVDKIQNILESQKQIVTMHFSKSFDSKIINGKIIYKNNNEIKFLFSSSTKDLAKLILELNPDKVFVEEPSIEDIVMHYYE